MGGKDHPRSILIQVAFMPVSFLNMSMFFLSLVCVLWSEDCFQEYILGVLPLPNTAMVVQQI